MENNRLIAIPSAEWPRLRDLYRLDWPANLTAFYTLDTFRRWSTETRVPNLIVYSLDGDWTRDGTFVCVHRYQLFAHTLSPSAERLRIALNLLDWSGGYVVSALNGRLRPSVLSVLDAHKHRLDYCESTLLYYMGHEQALQLDITCPFGIKLHSLSVEHAQQVNDAWPSRHHGSLFLVRQIIEHNCSVGAFDENGQLVAWCLRFQNGLLGAMQVLDTHQRRGLGSLVCAAFSKRLAESGIDSCACVDPQNVASIRTLEKVGFGRFVGEAESCCWIRNIPTVASTEWMDL